MDNDRTAGGWAEGLEFVPDPAAKRHALEQFAQLLEGSSRAEAGRTAPAHGLALASVGYPPELGWLAGSA